MMQTVNSRLFSYTTLYTLWIFHLIPVGNCLEYLKFGFISPTVGPYGYETSAAATTMAIAKAKEDGLWKDVNVT